jgi:hypothetical protein
MQRYQFCTIETRGYLTTYTPTGPVVVQLKRDKVKGDRTHADAVARTIAELGLAGWQLAAVSGSEWHFQRPLS